MDRGRALLAEFSLDPAIVHLNHGSFGAVPRAVQQAHAALSARIEANPSRFFRRDYLELIRGAAESVADFLGGTGEEWAFVDNATTGVNTVLASFPLAPGDEIVVTDHVYPAMRKAAHFHARRTGAVLVEARVPFPLRDGAQVLEALEAAFTPRTRLCLLDHVTSETALVFPVAEAARLCHDAGIALLVDGAHAPGMLPLDVPALGVDFWTGNGHKWLFTPRGCAFLWCAPAWRGRIRPLMISHGYEQGFTAEFDWVGTRDVAAPLSAPAAIAFHRRLGGPGLMARNAALAAEAAEMVAADLGTEVGGPVEGSIAAVRLPARPDETDREALHDRLREDSGIETFIQFIGDAAWVRLSAQAYNELDDYQRLAQALRNLK